MNRIYLPVVSMLVYALLSSVPILVSETQADAPDVIDTIIVSATNPDPVYTSAPIEVGSSYLIKVSGTYNYGGGYPYPYADAGYATLSGWPNLRTDIGIRPTTPEPSVGKPCPGVSSLLVDFGYGIEIVDWGDFRSNHVYTYEFVATSNVLGFVISDWWDEWYGSQWDNQNGMVDNSGFLTVEITPEPGTLLLLGLGGLVVMRKKK